MPSRPIRLMLVLVLGLSLALPAGATAQQPEPEAGLRFLTGPNDGEPNDIAIAYLREEANSFGVSSADVSDLAVLSSYISRHNGVTHVSLNQRFEGLEVFGAQATVNIARDGSVIFVGGGALVANLAAGASGSIDTDATEAVEAAADALGLDAPRNLRVMRGPAGTARDTLLSGGGISDQPIPARLGWQPTEGGLRLAWQLVIDDTSDVHLWNATVDAETGSCST
jgi:extracellular elastinolytic metalloproteinase